ncbi:MAG: HDOD domain-containing protein [Methyloprofundus sp.]|nr:HDOD domain-containing protein [Methyloprofundus sp.]
MIDTEPTNLESWTHTLHDREMPIFSSTTQKIQALINEDKKSAKDLAEIIMHDPNLSAKVLKISNTIYYNPSSRKMLTVTRAIIVLGFVVIKELTIICVLFDAILSQKNKAKANEEIATAIHSAVQAKALAVLADDIQAEEVFLATLLKNIGDIAFWCFSNQKGEEVLHLLQQGMPKEKAEQQVLGFHLNHLSQSLCQSWQLTGLIEESIHNIKNSRSNLVDLGQEIPSAIEQGWDSEEMEVCLEKLEDLTGKSPKYLKESLRDNTESAIQIAKQFGAHEASNLIKIGPDKKEQETTLEAEEKQKIQFQILQDISQLLSGKINLDELFELAVKGIHLSMGMDRSCFMLASPDKKSLHEKFSLDWNKNNTEQKINFLLTSKPTNLFKMACQSNQGIWASPQQHQAYFTSHVVNTIGRVECFLLPLFIGSNLIGLFYADRASNTQSLTQEEFNLAKHFTQQASLGLNLFRIQK